jgi:Putative Flp pilus-assembly TadE/G-like
VNRLHSIENGQIVALVALSIVVLMGFLSIAVDVGMLWTERRQMQTAADAAAIAAALALRDGDKVSTAGKNASSLNSFTDGVNNVSVTINNPPASGPYAGNSTYVEAIVAQPQTTFFMRALGYNTVNLSTRAVSGAVSGPDCIYALDPSDSNAFVASGGTDITSLCGLFVDSDSTSGLVVSGGSKVSFAGGIGVVASSETEAPGVAFTTGVAPVTDPLADVRAPTVGTCTPSTASGHGYSSTGGDTISQGTYCGGITVSGGKTLNLNAGTYILLGGGLQVNGSSNLIGSGVTFFNTVWMSSDPEGDKVGNSNQYKPIVFSGGSSTNLTAPSTGSLQGILFFQDRNLPSADTGPSGPQNTISGGSGAILAGGLYFPTTPLAFSGGSSVTPLSVILVGYTITISGGTTLSSKFASIGGSPVKSETLYE